MKFGCAHEVFDFFALATILLMYRPKERPEFFTKSIDELFYNRNIQLDNGEEPLIRTREDDENEDEGNQNMDSQISEINDAYKKTYP